MSKEKTALSYVISWLSDKFTDYKVSNERDKDLSDKFIVVSRDGGERRDMVMDICDFVISIYDKNSSVECAKTADKIADDINEMLSLDDDITKCSINTMYENNDIRIGYKRIDISATIFYRR